MSNIIYLGLYFWPADECECKSNIYLPFSFFWPPPTKKYFTSLLLTVSVFHCSALWVCSGAFGWTRPAAVTENTLMRTLS